MPVARPSLLASLWLCAVMAACSSKGPGASVRDDEHAVDGGTGTQVGTTPKVEPGDAGPSDGLSVQIVLAQKASGLAGCGCVALTAQVEGGTPPYAYSWSDASYEGPGPHTLCGADGLWMQVTVSDSGGEGEEFANPAQSGAARSRIWSGSCAGDAAVGGEDASARAHDAATSAEDAGTRICACSNDAPGPDEIYVNNPSFEGTPGVAATIPGWSSCAAPVDLLPVPGSLDAASHPAHATDGATYLGLPLPSAVTQRLKTKLRAGVRHWMSWDAIETGSFFAGGGAVFSIWLGDGSCQRMQVIADEGYRSGDALEFWHYCSQFIPEQDYEFITVETSQGGSFGPGYVHVDNLRIASYDFETAYEFGIQCAHVPLASPFP